MDPVVAARKIGRPVRSLNDCLAAAIASRSGASLFQRDRDFASIAQATTLVLHTRR
ncbi:MAG: hypothetical protein ACTIL2_11640 [Corynebacterium sp.]|uniref:hypothetical protein n=1 Tax=Corynebacterium sp. TaxID=1720 RepID=UPI003F99E77E